MFENKGAKGPIGQSLQNGVWKFLRRRKTYLSFLKLIEVTIGIYIQSGYGKSLS